MYLCMYVSSLNDIWNDETLRKYANQLAHKPFQNDDVKMFLKKLTEPVPTRIEVFNTESKNLYDDFYHINWQTYKTVSLLSDI